MSENDIQKILDRSKQEKHDAIKKVLKKAIVNQIVEKIWGEGEFQIILWENNAITLKDRTPEQKQEIAEYLLGWLAEALTQLEIGSKSD